MGLKSALIKPFAQRVVKRMRKASNHAIPHQQEILQHIVQKARSTKFGLDHNFADIQDHTSFKQAVSLHDYEDLTAYIEQIRQGVSNVLWPGRPKFFAKTSGTTSGAKYIPLTTESLPYHVNSARDGLFNHFIETNNGRYFDGKMVYLSGSPLMEENHQIPVGRLSGIVNHQIPSWAKGNKLPSHRINCMDDWEQKVSAIATESKDLDVRLVGGIPPWVQMYYEHLLAQTGKKTIKEIFPNLSLFIYGGVNFEPYRAKLEELVGDRIDSLETFPASEGFFAYQDKFPSEGLLLNVNAGMFFEFVPVDQLNDEYPERLSLDQVDLGVNYALIVSSNAGLWAYNIGDTVEFVSKDPYRLVVTGRTKHFISAFGEHVIGKEVDTAMLEACANTNAQIVEFTVAPQVNPVDGLPYHEWLIEFARLPTDMELFAKTLDISMQNQNVYYRDLIEGKVLRPIIVSALTPGSFRRFMLSIGKLGGQNKVPRLANDRKMAKQLIALSN